MKTNNKWFIKVNIEDYFQWKQDYYIFFLSFIFQSINVHQRKDTRRGVVNNQILDWSFKLDGIFNNAAQDQVFETVGADIVTSALDGYNGKNRIMIVIVNYHSLT